MSDTGYWALAVASAFSSGLLAYAGGLHVLRRGAFRSIVANQGVIPFRHVSALTAVFTSIQFIVGVCGLIAAAVARHTLTVGLAVIVSSTLLAVTCVYVGMIVYLARVVRLGTGAPCGCFGGYGAANFWTIARACGLGIPPTALAFVVAPDLSGEGIVGGAVLLTVVGVLLVATRESSSPGWDAVTGRMPGGSEAS